VRERSAEEGSPVRCWRDGTTLHIALSRPDVHNAFDARMRDALIDALAAGAATDIETIELAGDGPSFCSGGDLDEFGSFPDPATAHVVRLQRSAARAIAAVADRVVARVHGACIGSGIELPAFAAKVVAQPDTVIALPEVGFGLVPGAGGTVSLPRRIGRHRTAWLALSGARIDATTAHAWGLVDAIEP
jgi:enoyl-CoA hydratase/carnithine racemase